MVSTTDRKRRLLESRLKICPPAKLDDSLCMYCPQDNLDALGHPRVRQWIRFVTRSYVPRIGRRDRTILLLLPCTKQKPYPLSPEHLSINARLLRAGFLPEGGPTLPGAFSPHLPEGFPPSVLSLAPLRKGSIVIHRAVMSEPLVFVPYAFAYMRGGRQSVACAYDDPGLFEARGNAVSPWRRDFTGIRVSDNRWRWGDNERRAYVAMHNTMSGYLARLIARLAPRYEAVVAWVAPGLTHRSFLLERGLRAANGIPASRRVGSRNLTLVGANDILPAETRIECLPTPAQCEAAKRRLAKRLRRPISAIGGHYSRGGCGATPLALPELLTFLVSRLERDA
jgi:hypothetical protein